MTDRELLEAAAKAAGIRLEWDGDPKQWQPMYYEGKTYHSFDPLTDDGDAFRLMCRLNINISYRENIHGAWVLSEREGINFCPESLDDEWGTEETRRAIVRAAAEIGKN